MKKLLNIKKGIVHRSKTIIYAELPLLFVILLRLSKDSTFNSRKADDRSESRAKNSCPIN